MANIFELAQQLEEVFFDIEENEGLMDDNLSARLQFAEEDLKTKIDAYVYFIKELKAKNSLIDDEIATFNEKKASNNNKADRLKEVLKMIVQRQGEPTDKGTHRLKTDTRSLWTKHSQSVQLDDDFDDGEYGEFALAISGLDEDDLYHMKEIARDNEFGLKSSFKADKKLIKETLISGKEVEGAELIVKTSINMR